MNTTSNHEAVNEGLAVLTGFLLLVLTAQVSTHGITAAGAFCLATLALATGFFWADLARKSGLAAPSWTAFAAPATSAAGASSMLNASGELVFALILFSGFVVMPCVVALQGPDPVAERPVVAPLRLRMPARTQVARASCQVCGELLTHDVVSCAACDTPHHADCFSYAEKCSTYGCGCRRAA